MLGRAWYIISDAMEDLGPAGEFLRLTDHYRRMSDGELLLLARQPSELTAMAQGALANEMSARRLRLEPEEPKLPARPAARISAPRPPRPASPERSSTEIGADKSGSDESGRDDPDPYAKDRELFTIVTVWSLEDALQVQQLLDQAGIPFSMGREKATDVGAVTSNFADGVDVQIMRIGWPWAQQALRFYEPKNKPPEFDEEPREIPVRCPICHSTEVVFERLVPVPGSDANEVPPKFKWTCDSCHHEWEDDGVVKE